MISARFRTLVLAMAFSASAPLASSGSDRPTELRILAPNAVKEAVVEIGARYASATNTQVAFTWTGSEAIARRIDEGQVFDVVLTTNAGIDRMAATGSLDARNKANFARSAVAVAIRSGLPHPDVSTVDGLKKALLDAKSIAISSGASGRYLQDLFQKLGVAAEIGSRIKQPPSGAQIGDMLARGEADLGFQQVTELIHAKGFDYLGTLPAEVQNYTVWSAAVHVRAANAEAAQSFVRALVSSASSVELRKAGLDPASE